jgi:plasmid stabilization system protein ParE
MVEPRLRVVIDEEAKQSLREAYKHIRKDSLQNAEQVREAIKSSLRQLGQYPKRHGLDKYRLNNDGNYRAYEIKSYRITYHISATEIRVIRIRHTKMNPLEY